MGRCRSTAWRWGRTSSAGKWTGRRWWSRTTSGATFTASKLSFWQDASEVAYVSNNRLYITNITVLEGVSIGEWEISSENGLVIRWMGG